MTKFRINKYLSDAGMCSRRGADEHILIGDVLVNDKPAVIGQVIDSDIDIVKFKNKIVNNDQPQIVYAFYKPTNVVATFSNNEKPNLNDYFQNNIGLKYAGRLDKDSEGLMILSNNGDFINTLSHPKYEHEKEYVVFAEDERNSHNYDEIASRTKKGIRIDNTLMKIDSITNFEKSGKRLKFNVILSTGYNRQIRRMFAKMNIRVEKIVRVRIAKLKLNELNLKPGKYIKINKTQIYDL